MTSASSRPPVCGRSIPGVAVADPPEPASVDRFPPSDHTLRPARPGVSDLIGNLSPPPITPPAPCFGLAAASNPFIPAPYNPPLKVRSPPKPKSAVANASSLNVGACKVCM